MHLANSDLWIAAYHDLEVLNPGRVVTLAVLDFFLSWESHQSQNCGSSASRFYYLQSGTVLKLTGDPDHDKYLIKKCLGLSKEPIDCAPVIFLVTPRFRQNTYFLVLFDFSEKKVLILGRCSPGPMYFMPARADWETWDGPALWRRIGKAFNWPTCEMTAVDVYEENWIIVCLYIKLL
jgi:hypothetical protein